MLDILGYRPPVGFHFIVHFNGLQPTGLDNMFQSVSGLSASIETEELAVGGQNRYMHVLPVRTKYPNLVLKRGMLVESQVIKWCQDAIENFEFKPIDLQIMLLNEYHIPITVWNVIHAYPIRWEVDELNSMENKLVTETIELTYHYYNVITPSDLLTF
jgi:phage tail-like protein